MAEPRSRGLGRGLSALLGDTDTPAPVKPPPVQVKVQAPAAASAAANTEGSVRYIPIELLRRNPQQPRRHFEDSEITELATSVKEKGVLQPILVRPAPGAPGEWQIVAGERRWRAAQRAGLQQVPVLIRELNDLEVLEVAIVENVQRSDLNPVEEAQGYKALMDRFGRTQESVAQTVGKSRSHVANSVRLLHLPEEVLQHLVAGRLSAGHARAIATAKDPGALARKIVDQGLNVRQAEALTKTPAPDGKAANQQKRGRNADIQTLEQDLSDVLGIAVEIRDNGGAGEIRLRYATLEQLDDVCRRLTSRSGSGF
jgi:ParB family chromosome partitioning protein